MTLAILFCFIIYIVVTVKIMRRIWKSDRPRENRYAWLAFFILFPTWDSILGGVLYFNYLCLTQGGLKVIKTVENVDGYFDEGNKPGCGRGCVEDLLIERKYEFIEMEVKKPQKDFLTLEPGLYRFSRAEKGSPACELYYEEKSRYHYYNEIPERYCVATERITTLKSMYSAHLYDFDRHYIPLLNIARGQSSIRDIQSGEVYGTATSFVYYGPWWIQIPFGGDVIRKCPKTTGKTYIHSSLLDQVLIPKQSR